MVRPYGIAVDDPAGAVYVVGQGHLIQGATFQNEPIRSDSTDAFLVKYDLDGTQEWARPGAFAITWGSPFSAFHVAAAGSGDVFTSEGIVEIMDANMLTHGGLSVNRYAASGEPLWTRTWIETEQQIWKPSAFVKGLGTDAEGNVYVGGVFQDSLLLGADLLRAVSEADVFIASFDGQGALRWSEHIEGSAHSFLGSQFNLFSVDPAGRIYLASWFASGSRFGSGQPGAIQLQHDATVVACYDHDGTLQWIRTSGPEGNLHVAGEAWLDGLAADPAGRLTLLWHVPSNGSIEVGDTRFDNYEQVRAVLTQYDPDGTLRWAVPLHSSYDLRFSNLAADAAGNIYLGGSFEGNWLQLEDRRFVRRDLQLHRDDGFAAVYDANGALRWATWLGGPGVQRVNAIAVDGTGNLYLAGEFQDSLALGTNTLVARGWLDMFVLRYDASTITAREEQPSARASRLSTFPNPFADAATIRVVLDHAGPVRLTVYDVRGREVARLIDEWRPAGTLEVEFDGRRLAPGVYFYALETGGQRITRPIVLAR